ncbi:acyl-CoA dehydrogenase family protein [Paractinoplanes durhamensis]|uniref:acyl-CoA dehydrogenase family protein n=1 Tax=Paractinoplanes durhamensis TaxID=113563 RepID=UPI0019443EF4
MGRPVATTDRFKAAAGEIEALLTTAERLLLDATTRFDEGAPVTGAEALAARTIANRHAVAAVTLATRLLGNPALSRDNPLERHFRDVQSAQVHAPQEDVALQAIGTAALAAAKPPSSPPPTPPDSSPPPTPPDSSPPPIRPVSSPPSTRPARWPAPRYLRPNAHR